MTEQEPPSWRLSTSPDWYDAEMPEETEEVERSWRDLKEGSIERAEFFADLASTYTPDEIAKLKQSLDALIEIEELYE